MRSDVYHRALASILIYCNCVRIIYIFGYIKLPRAVPLCTYGWVYGLSRGEEYISHCGPTSHRASANRLHFTPLTHRHTDGGKNSTRINYIYTRETGGDGGKSLIVFRLALRGVFNGFIRICSAIFLLKPYRVVVVESYCATARSKVSELSEVHAEARRVSIFYR